jgi:hypothetical protein
MRTKSHAPGRKLFDGLCNLEVQAQRIFKMPLAALDFAPTKTVVGS